MEESSQDFTLNRIIMHKINKSGKAGESGIAQINNKPLNIRSSDILQFGETISISYHKRTAKEYGKFKESPIPTYQTALDKYLGKNTDESFLKFTEDATNHLKDEMNRTTATGGYLIFADYEVRDRFVMAVLLNNKAGFTVNEEKLLITMIKELNIDQIAMAGFMNISIYKGVDKDRRYMSFMRGKKEISEYFVNFMGANEDKGTTKETTKLLVKTINDYLETIDYDETHKTKDEQISSKKMDIYNYCDNKRAIKDIITIEEISSFLNPAEPKKFFEHVNELDIELDNTIESIDKTQINKLKIFKYDGKGIKLTFNRELFDRKDIYLSKDKKELIIKIDSELKQLIEEELPC